MNNETLENLTCYNIVARGWGGEVDGGFVAAYEDVWA